MGLRFKRLGVVALLGVAAFASVAVGQVLPEDGLFISLGDTECWPCHKDDAPVPMRAIVNVLPPPGVSEEEPGTEIPIGIELPYTLTVQNAWLNDVRYIAPSINLTAAPSLAFGGGPPDELDVEIAGAVPFDPTLIAEEQTERVEIEVTGGASSLQVELAPQDTGPTAPDFILRIFPPESPETSPYPDYDDGGPGEPEYFEVLSPEEFEGDGYGYGNWTFEVVYQALKQDTTPPNVSPAAEEVPFTITYSLLYDTAGLRSLELPRETDMKPKGQELFTFGLMGRQTPAAGEYITIKTNTTPYHNHEDSSYPDWGYVTQEMVMDVVEGPTGAPMITPRAGENVIVRPPGNIPVSLDRISEAVGYFAAFLLISSIWSGGMFGKASRRQMNTFFGSAKRSVAFHNFLSYGLILPAIVHTVLFVIEKQYYWTVGIIWGGVAILAMFLLGVTGALQVQMIRKWSYGFWRWNHYGMAVAAIVFTIVHGLLDGANFTSVADAVGWSDPLDPRGVAD